MGASSLEDLTAKTVPANILLSKTLDLGAYTEGLSESDAIAEIKRIASSNKACITRTAAPYWRRAWTGRPSRLATR